MKPRLPIPIFVLLTTTALGLTTTITGGDDFWEKAAQSISESLSLLLSDNIYTNGASDLVVNSDLTVTVPSGTTASLDVDTGSGGVIVSSGKSATFTGLKDVSFGGATTGSRKANPEANYTGDSRPVTGGIFIGENSSMSVSGNSGSVSNSGNSFSSSERSSSVGSGGAAYFVAKGGTLELNNNEGGVAVNNNHVTLSALYTEARGAGIMAYTNARVNICGNSSVSLSNNGVSSSTYSASGAALYAGQSAIVTISNNRGTVDISNNSTVVSSSSTVYGGAIGMAGGSQLIIADNEAVTITGNSATTNGTGNAYAGAIRLDNSLSITGNSSVLIANNRAQGTTAQVQGGAIRNAGSGSITISGNGSVRILDNTAITADSTKTTQNRMGGAIYSGANLSLCDNGELLFSGNSIRTGVTAVNRWNALGGAIYAAQGLTISGNDSVVFEKNYEQRGSSTVLRGIYQRSASNVQLQLSAKEGGSIIFREALYSELSHANARAVFNGSYDAASGAYAQTGSGDIIFSGASTKADLNALRSEHDMAAATSADISKSRLSEISAEAAVLGGSLRVEDEAYLDFAKGLTVFEGATLALSRGAWLEAADITMNSGTTLSLEGAANYILADTFSMGTGSLVSLTLDAGQKDEAALTLANVDVSAGLLSGITLELGGFEQIGSGSYKLFTIWGTEEITTYDTSGFTLRGEGVDAGAFRWDADEQTLFYDYVSPDIVADSSSGNIAIESPTTGNIIVRDNQTAMLNSALQAGGAATGDITIEHGIAAIGEGGSLSGRVIFDDTVPEALRTLELSAAAAIPAIELRAAEGNTICVSADTATVSSISGSGALEKQGSGTLILSGSESRVQGEVTVAGGTLQLQDGASVAGDSISLGSRSRAAVTAEIVTETLSISPQNGVGSIRNHCDITSDGTALGGTAEAPAEFENILLRLLQETSYTLNDAVLNGSRVELAESGASLNAANLTMDSGAVLLATGGASITLSGDNSLVVNAAENGTTEHINRSFTLHNCEQLDGVTLAAGSSLSLDLNELIPTSPYIAIFFRGLSCETEDTSLSVAASYRLLDTARNDNGLTLYLQQTPEPTVPVLLLGAMTAFLRRRRA